MPSSARPSVPFDIVSPIDGKAYHQGIYLSREEAFARVAMAEKAARSFRSTSVIERIELCKRFVAAFEASLDANARTITEMMGKPLSQARAEFGGMRDRALTLCALAEETLADEGIDSDAGYERWIRHEPLGVVLDIAAWNYPLLVAVNVVVPAVLAGNAVLLKHSPQTALVGRQFEAAFRTAGSPEGLVSDFMVDHELAGEVLESGRLAHVAFTGSVAGGKAVLARATSQQLIGTGLELGGKDAAIVLPDANVAFAAMSIADGALYNAGQSCCAVERIYVHASIENDFVEALIEEVKKLRLGNPLEADVSLGPVVSQAASARICRQLAEARTAGARQLVGEADFDVPTLSECYLAPHVLDGVDHTMALMRDESFGPVVGVMSFKDEGEALKLANDSPYGLTASIWTQDLQRAARLGAALQCGTIFANRADFVDPELPWSGVKDSGLGCTLSHHGLLAFTRPKSFHLRRPG